MAIVIQHPETSQYSLNEHVERCLIAGDETAKGSQGPALLIVPPLFEEANKLRRLLVQFMSTLAHKHGIASVLPDLPGTLESERSLSGISLLDWHASLVQVTEQHGHFTHIMSLRSGCDIACQINGLPQWHLAPLNAWRHLRTLARTQLASEREAGGSSRSLDDMLNDIVQNGGKLAGYTISALFAKELKDLPESSAQNIYQVRLSGDEKAADNYITGTPLWLRSEPSEDHDMALAMATDVAQWMTA
ncbi:hypothetical protein ACR9YC_05860 [Parasphingorhabdus sp. DH2-15]|uniref:hypothetical protein n=1 Tax=Parasphingorhabdus sp. DH2-15 TaxID=3444112 RepID=UPI003F6840BE